MAAGQNFADERFHGADERHGSLPVLKSVF